MEKFEQYADRVISGLEAPKDIEAERFNFPIKGSLADLGEESVEIESIDESFDFTSIGR